MVRQLLKRVLTVDPRVLDELLAKLAVISENGGSFLSDRNHQENARCGNGCCRY